MGLQQRQRQRPIEARWLWAAVGQAGLGCDGRLPYVTNSVLHSYDARRRVPCSFWVPHTGFIRQTALRMIEFSFLVFTFFNFVCCFWGTRHVCPFFLLSVGLQTRQHGSVSACQTRLATRFHCPPCRCTCSSILKPRYSSTHAVVNRFSSLPPCHEWAFDLTTVVR